MGEISVIIRNRNEEDWIGHAIQSCLDHFDDPEIIIIDNKSNDQSLEIVNEFCFSNIKVHNIDSYTPGRALNYGVGVCSNETVLVLSAHSQIINMPPLDEIKNLLDNYVAVFGKQTPVYKGKKISKRYIWSHFHEKPSINMYSKIENRYFLHNAFSFYEKETLIKYPFDEDLSTKEDR